MSKKMLFLNPQEGGLLGLAAKYGPSIQRGLSRQMWMEFLKDRPTLRFSDDKRKRRMPRPVFKVIKILVTGKDGKKVTPRMRKWAAELRKSFAGKDDSAS
jgi:hypothetical protein